MNCNVRRIARRGLNLWAFVTFILWGLVGCGTPDSTPNQRATALPAANAYANPPATTTVEITAVPTASVINTTTPEPTWTWIPPGAGTKEAYWTAVAQSDAAILTEVAL